MTGKTWAGIVLGAVNLGVFALFALRGVDFTWPVVAVFCTVGVLAGLLIDRDAVIELLRGLNPFQRGGG